MKNTKVLSVFLSAATCLSFCAALWYYSRGSQYLVQMNLPRLSHELSAFFIAGIVPSIVFELIMHMFSLKKRSVRISSGPYNQYSRSGFDALPPEALELLMRSEFKKMAAFRIFLICANLVCFGLSFLYFHYRMLYVWGKILLHFLVSLLFFAGFLIFWAGKTEKNKLAFLIMQTGRIYFSTYCLLVLIEIAFSVSLI